MSTNCHNGVYNKVLSLFTTVTFQKVLNGESSIELLLAAQTALLKARIPYQVTYSIGTPSEAASANLMIYITPIWTMSFVFSFQSGDPASLQATMVKKQPYRTIELFFCLVMKKIALLKIKHIF